MGKYSKLFMGRMQLQFLKTCWSKIQESIFSHSGSKMYKKKISFYNYMFRHVLQVVACFYRHYTVYKQSGKSFWFNLKDSNFFPLVCLFIDDISCYLHKHIIPGKENQAFLLANEHRGPLQQEFLW